MVLASEEVQFEDWGPEFVPGEGFRDGTEMNLEGHTVSSLLDPFMPSHCGECWAGLLFLSSFIPLGAWL